jgi:hypothetical protein
VQAGGPNIAVRPIRRIPFLLELPRLPLQAKEKRKRTEYYGFAIQYRQRIIDFGMKHRAPVIPVGRYREVAPSIALGQEPASHIARRADINRANLDIIPEDDHHRQFLGRLRFLDVLRFEPLLSLIYATPIATLE